MKTFLMLLCSYELGALLFGWWPTVTSLVHQHRATNPAVVVAVCAFNGWVYYHLLVEGR